MFTVPGYVMKITKVRKRRVNRIPFKQTDGGKLAAGFLNETRDCTVRSLAIAADIDYSDAHKICAESGRRPRQGLTDHGIELSITKVASRFNRRAIIIPRPKKQLQSFEYTVPHGTFSQMREKYNQGRYIFVGGRHAFAVIDGVLHDSWHVGGRTKVGMIIKFDRPEPKQEITQTQINELWARLDKLEGKC